MHFRIQEIQKRFYTRETKQDRQLGLTLPLYLYLYSYKIGQVVRAYPLSLFIQNMTYIFIQNRRGRWGLPSLYIYLYKIGQVVRAYPLSLFIQNMTGSWGLPSVYISTSIGAKQDRQLGLTRPLYLYLYCRKQDRQLGLTLPLYLDLYCT